MILSMTGYSSKSVEIGLKNDRTTSLNIELKSLNSRYFETVCRLPSSLSFLETTISSKLKERLTRGKVYLTITIVAGEGELESLAVSMPLVESYISESKNLKDKFNLSGELTVSDVVSLPNIFVSRKVQIEGPSQAQIIDAVLAVADQLTEVRRAEGANLKVDLKQQVDRCFNLIKKISDLYDRAMQDQKALVSELKDKFLHEADEETKILLEDAYAVLNKMDINEEVIRFKSHIKSLEKLFENENVEKGKRFDFILQELLREINTISAKSSNFEINSHAIDVKVELEKAREQIQNVL